MYGGGSPLSSQGKGSGKAPPDEHVCTDPLCCILFIVAIVAWGGSYSYGLSNGNPEKMFHGIQSVPAAPGSTTYVNAICGVDPGVETKGLLYWCMKGDATAIYNGQLQEAFGPVCVDTCPTDAGMANAVPTECIDAGYAQAATAMGYVTYNFLGKYCLPSTNPPQNINITDLVGGQMADTATEIFESLSSVYNAWPILLTTFFVALILGYVFLTLLKCCAEPLIWITMIASIIGFAILGVYMWVHSDSLQETAANQQQIPDQVSDNISNGSKFVAAFCMVLSMILLCVMCCFCSSIKLAAAVVEVACEVIWEMPILLVLPVIKALMKGAASFAILYGFIWLWTCSDAVTTGGDGVSRHFEHSNTDWGFILYFLFASLWILAFLNAQYQFVVASMVGDYYYEPYNADGGKDGPNQCGSLVEAYTLGFGKHAGSLAFGSLIIAIIEFIQKLLEYAEKKNKEGGNNHVISCIIGCLLCCFQCCKEVIEYINKNAYIDIAISGDDSFCTAAQKVFQVIAGNAGAMAILSGATYVFSIFGTLFVSLGGVAVCYMMTNLPQYSDYSGSSTAVPDKVAVCVVAFMISVVVATCFMHVFEMAADTLVYCYGYDMLERHGLSPGCPRQLAVIGGAALHGEDPAEAHENS